ncbi:MAG: hypothetical protein B7Z81_09945 [Acidocella sp. 20-61-6]|nr:MAG: hypothetical protein B7Z81_09945 [Acidocella sp. 20-61-6]
MRKLLLASAATMGALLATTGGAMAQPAKPVAPGTVVVHFNGYLEFGIGDIGSTFNTHDGYKINPITTEGDARIYAGFDAQTLTGIEYGAQIETRVTSSNAGKAVGSSSASSNGFTGVYVRRAYGYIGAKDAGFLRFGQGDGGFTLLQTGVLESFGDGQGFNSDGGIYSAVPGNAAPGQFIFADTGNLYATSKLVYLSPEIAGFAAAVTYEPNSNGLKEGYASNGTASSTSGALAASPTASDIGARRKNLVDADLTYTMKMDGFKTKIGGGILHAAPIAYDGTAALPAADNVDELNVYQGGIQTSFGGLTVGGNIKGGSTLDSYSFKPKGARNAFAYIVGATYTVGPYVLGAYYFDNQTAGNYTPGKAEARTLNEDGVAVGANYVVGKDMSLYLQYLYGQRHQPGNTALNNGYAQMNAISTGATLKW